ncbi:MAG: UpxY family transcription antiterminator [Bacteroides sp.]|nr:UpxY family transcription antiterminator [Bacteroides sp.]
MLSINSQPLGLNSQLFWYAIRVTYSRELALKAYLDAEGIENFIPMRYEYAVKNERRVRKLVPAIHNLVFVRSTRQRIDEIKEIPGMTIPISYIMDREHHRPIVIPDAQMRSFMAVSASYEQAVIYFEPTELHIPKGTRVRITGGIFAGVEGEFVRIRHDRRVVVSIEGVMAVATTYIHPSLVEPIVTNK